MTYTIDTTIMGPSRLNGDAFGEWLVDHGAPIPEDARAYGRALDTWAPIIGVRGEVAAGQSLQETYYPPDSPTRKPLNSRWARERRNYAGMGVTGDPVQNEASPTFATVEAFAIAQLLHLRLYAKGLSLPDGHPELDDANPRRQNAIDAGYIGQAPTIKGLANTWAKDPAYATGIVAHMDRLEAAGVFTDTAAGDDIVLDTTTGGTTVGFDIGNRPLRIAIGTGHANTSGGNEFELGINRLVTNEVINLLRASKGFEVKCYTPNDGLGYFNGPLDAAAAQVRTWWAQGWQADILHEVHQEGLGQSSVRGGFVIYPDSSGLSGRKASGGDDVDIDVRDAAGEMAKRIVAAYGGVTRYTPARGMSERETGVGGDGYRLGVFGAWSEAYLVNSTCRFISEGATYTNPTDLAMMKQAGFAAKQARGIVDAYVYLAKTKGNWTYPYEIAGTVTTPTTPETPQLLAPVDPWFLSELASKGYADDEGTIWYADNADYVVSAPTGTRQLRFATAGGGTIGSDLSKGATVHAIAKGQSKTDKKIYIVAANKARILRDDLKAA